MGLRFRVWGFIRVRRRLQGLGSSIQGSGFS